MRLKWFQYEISLAAYCFEWWEKAFVHLCVLGVLALFVYGFWRQACAIAPAVQLLAAKYLPRRAPRHPPRRAALPGPALAMPHCAMEAQDRVWPCRPSVYMNGASNAAFSRQAPTI